MYICAWDPETNAVLQLRSHFIKPHVKGLSYKQHSLPCTTDSKMHTLCDQVCTPQKSNTCLLHGKIWVQDKADN